MRRVLFLDIDGVLNSTRWFRARSGFRPEDGRPFSDLDPAAVKLLDRIVHEADAEIVLSSTWRLLYPIDAVSSLLATMGLRRRIAGKTPAWHTRPPGMIVGAYPTRGREIQAWLEAQDEWPDGIAIVDDDSDMGDLMPWLVQTTGEDGLRPAHVAAVVGMLKRPGPPLTREARGVTGT